MPLRLLTGWLLMTADPAEVAALLADLAACCPICATYRCAGHRPREDCGHWAEVNERHDLGDHRYCHEDDGCDFARGLRADVLAAGLPGTTTAKPLALVVLDGSGRPTWTGQSFGDHRTAKPARTRAGGGGFAAKGRAWLVCGRCHALH